MTKIQRSLTMPATSDAIWAVLGRYMHIDDFAPEVSSVEALTHGENGVGSKRRCVFENGSSLVEEVNAWTPGKGYRVRASEFGTMPLHHMNAELEVIPMGAQGVRVVWSVDYRVKYGPLGWLLGQTMMKGMMGKVLDGNLKGLADQV